MIDRQRLTSEQRWVAQRDLGYPGRESDAGGLRGEGRQDRPAFEPRGRRRGVVDEVIDNARQIKAERFDMLVPVQLLVERRNERPLGLGVARAFTWKDRDRRNPFREEFVAAALDAEYRATSLDRYVFGVFTETFVRGQRQNQPAAILERSSQMSAGRVAPAFM